MLTESPRRKPVLRMAIIVSLLCLGPSFAAPPLVSPGGVGVTTGLPHLNLGFPTHTIMAPGVGEVVRLAHGFDRVPDFTYEFTHPLSNYMHPLEGGDGPNSNLRRGSATPKHFSTVPSNSSPAAHVGKLSVSPSANFKFLAEPWHVAASKAKYIKPVGIYGHFSSAKPKPGLYLTGIAKGGVGHRVGLLPGDVITHIKAAPVADFAHLNGGFDPTKPYPVTVWNSHTNRSSELNLSGIK